MDQIERLADAIRCSDIIKIGTWFVIRGEKYQTKRRQLLDRYDIDYTPIFYRNDSDDVLCFDSREKTLLVVHDFADKDYHRTNQTFVSFEQWLIEALEESRYLK